MANNLEASQEGIRHREREDDEKFDDLKPDPLSFETVEKEVRRFDEVKMKYKNLLVDFKDVLKDAT